MMNTVFTKIYDAPPINEKEILRYAGVKTPTDEIISLMRSCIGECASLLSYKVCYRFFPVKENGEILDLGFAEIKSADLSRNLEGCTKITLFAATVGLMLDRLIAKYERTMPSRAFMFQAIGAERVESLCDAFNEEIRAEYDLQGLSARPRFSPGYGDLPLSLQKDIFRVLDCERKIGVTLNESLIMSPSKSVTAIIGARKK
ncbi:MAG: vitamin B12 dependent-methionine synthase activation domain-containing protein [Eubacteriales bacterium]